jgi:hypothetical protein
MRAMLTIKDDLLALDAALQKMLYATSLRLGAAETERRARGWFPGL